MLRYLAPSLLFAAVAAGSSSVAAQVFEVVEPDVSLGEVEFESLTGVDMTKVEPGGNRAAHEISFSISPLSFWKVSAAFELAHPYRDSVKYEGFEWENVFLLPFGAAAGRDTEVLSQDEERGEGLVTLQALSLYTALEIPNEGGFDSGEFAIGPIIGLSVWRVNTITNLFAEFPFEAEEDPGLAYAFSANMDVFSTKHAVYALGFEAHGAFDGVFIDAVPLNQQGHYLGPAIYSDINIAGFEIEPRLAFLMGLTDASSDAVASINLEVRF